MQKKTVYLAGKITGDPFYRSKFYEAQKKLEEGGFIVVNPAFPIFAFRLHAGQITGYTLSLNDSAAGGSAKNRCAGSTGF